ncbi:MAG: hypothetical protein H6623_03760 [Bdellovibrionaceae bacterium]|nr:hypothetical protein [Pseudobdellovibrionaceae bacterium]
MRLMLLFTVLVFSMSKSYAYMSLMTTGDILKQNQVQGMGYLEFWRGTNANARASMGINDSLQGDVEIGSGDVSFMMSAMVKWVPIPDYEKQPAMGIRGGLTYVNTHDYSQTSVVAMPFLSKAFQSPHGKFSPYASIPLAVNSNKDHSFFSARLVVGVEWTPLEQNNFHVIGEAGAHISKSFSSLNVGASYDF